MKIRRRDTWHGFEQADYEYEKERLHGKFYKMIERLVGFVLGGVDATAGKIIGSLSEYQDPLKELNIPYRPSKDFVRGWELTETLERELFGGAT